MVSAGVAELVDARDSKSRGVNHHGGSIPPPGISIKVPSKAGASPNAKYPACLSIG